MLFNVLQPKNFSFVTSQESGPLYDPQEPGPSSSQSRATRASNPRFRIREECIFCGFKKHHGDTRLITMQYQSVIDKLKKQCKVKNDTEFEVEVGVSFDDLLAYDAKHHLQCFNTYIKDGKSDQTSTIHQYCFELLIRQIDPLLNEGRALSMTNLFNQFESILKDNGDELFDCYSLARLKQRLVKYYSSEICFGKVQGKKKNTNQFNS